MSKTITRWVGGGNSNIFWNFHPENWGRWIHFDEHMFQRGWLQPPTIDQHFRDAPNRFGGGFNVRGSRSFATFWNTQETLHFRDDWTFACAASKMKSWSVIKSSNKKIANSNWCLNGEHHWSVSMRLFFFQYQLVNEDTHFPTGAFSSSKNSFKQFFLENSSFLDIYSFSIPNTQRFGNDVTWKYLDTLPKFNSSPLKSYRDPIRKVFPEVFQPPFFPGVSCSTFGV